MKVLDNIQIASVSSSIKPTELVTSIIRLNLTDNKTSYTFPMSQITKSLYEQRHAKTHRWVDYIGVAHVNMLM